MAVQVTSLTKRYGSRAALDGVTLSVPDGELMTILGPSGSGKTTLLRSIAGVESPDSGTISIGGRVVFDRDSKVDIPPEERGVGMVFQSNALWPHLTVLKNVSYPLEIRGDREARSKAEAILKTLKISGLAPRLPSEISGGEQQRVAIARSIVYNPSLVLLDEPFSSLDVPLREALRDDLRQLQLKVKMTMLYVTHERVDALSIGDTMAVLAEGRVKALGPPSELIASPPNSYTAEFVGGMLVIPGRVVLGEEGQVFSTEFGDYNLGNREIHSGGSKLCVPPVAFKLDREVAGGTIPGTVTGTVVRPSGAFGVRVSTSLGIVELTIHGGAGTASPGDKVYLSVDPARSIVLSD